MIRRALAVVAEVLVGADELDLVPAGADPEPKPAADNRSSDAACFATKMASRCAKINTPTAKPICWVQPDKSRTAERIVMGVCRGADAATAVIPQAPSPRAHRVFGNI